MLRNTNVSTEVASYSFYLKDAGTAGVLKFEVDYDSSVAEIFNVDKIGTLDIKQAIIAIKPPASSNEGLQLYGINSDSNSSPLIGFYQRSASGTPTARKTYIAWEDSTDELCIGSNICIAQGGGIRSAGDLDMDGAGDVTITSTDDLNLECGQDAEFSSTRILTLKGPSRTIARATNSFVPNQNSNSWGAGIMVGDYISNTIASGQPNAGTDRKRSYWFGVEQTSGSYRALGIGVNLTNNDDEPALGSEDTQLLGWFEPTNDGGTITFTAYHLCSTTKKDEFIDDNIGLVVESTGIYDSLDPLDGIL